MAGHSCDKICPKCGTDGWRADVEGNYRVCAECFRLYNNKRRQDLRDEAVIAYGGKCQCPGCGVTEPRFLTLDHINGNGAEHCRIIGREPSTLFILLKRQGWPSDDYQLLCWNCNCARQFNNGICPLSHQDHGLSLFPKTT